MTTRHTAICIDAMCHGCSWNTCGDDESEVLRRADHHASTEHHYVIFRYERHTVLNGEVVRA